MTLFEAIEARHSVRSYTDKKIEGETLTKLQEIITQCNQQSEMSFQLCLNEPSAFSGMLARYGKFVNANNYIALVGKVSDDLEEQCGYYGEKIVLEAQCLGLNTCWVGLSYSKGKSPAVVKPGEKLAMVISVGYGQTQGKTHKVKSIESLCNNTIDQTTPEWFINGMKAVQLAPTAVNQQKFRFELNGDTVIATAGRGFYAKADLGIGKCHFEIGADRGNIVWK